ncbi:hypothetical protein [Sphingobacterium corticibacter]|uniref:DUF2383 domain-containing protein n=1 Tax=Sphingobacterium corticibacter TaxID=2171749 RepID=A0A2T8HN73_9SPHI|nr:hypothetical protein [Sphingobacterium corticibacter]PVH26752.1 hypothetical protein DC487_03870 [Sphingobacterium corticibacter]
MQYNNEECIEILKRLIEANKERIKHYSESIKSMDNDIDREVILKFEELAQQSQQFKAQLTPLIYREGDVEHDNSSINTQVLHTNNHEPKTRRRNELLQTSVAFEAELLTIYKEVNRCNGMIDEQIKELIFSQATLVSESQNEIAQLIQD